MTVRMVVVVLSAQFPPLFMYTKQKAGLADGRMDGWMDVWMDLVRPVQLICPIWSWGACRLNLTQSRWFTIELTVGSSLVVELLAVVSSG